MLQFSQTFIFRWQLAQEFEKPTMQSEEVMKPEAFFPVAKDQTTVRTAQLAVLELLNCSNSQKEEMYRGLLKCSAEYITTFFFHQGIFKSEYFSCSS